ncbi:tetratricopeptide repeat protein [Vagococcus sp. BWB3-3]|uniref:Tetratricopeptide repeat protein n=1 Tax=Vagococcus allomyrinae TaxID=2794353 RepID=A0A940STF5_9ENTE|nr:tetratricopeptide repeat protein [Vagococcus allomyrinae]MBP1039629.1 tetratricopeptide repeat protein [Vagococcus allomyrinae]
MFDFLKKKTRKERPEPAKKELSEAEKKQQQQLIAAKKQECQQLESGQQADLLAKAYEELGVLQAVSEAEAAIVTLEQSFSYQVSLGEGYKTLMSLYNQKRSEAAYKGDGDEIDKWMGKMDDLRQIARNNTISN